MNIYSVYKDNVKEIYVIGELDSKNDKLHLLELLDDGGTNNFNITFFDAKILPVEIIERLSMLLEKKTLVKVEIIVMQDYLYHYLSRFSIRSKYVEPKSVKCEKTKGFDAIAPAILLSSDEKVGADSLNCLKRIDVLDKKTISTFLQDIYDTYGYDYREYEMSSIGRRIKKSMIQESMTNFDKFKSKILSDRSKFNYLFQEFSITTTEFFRNPETFKYIKEKVLPYLNSFPHIKIWCAGCSTGQEPYSIAIMLDELGILEKSQIYATDLNPYAVDEAKNGLYPVELADKFIKSYELSGGNKESSDIFEKSNYYIKIMDKYKKNILFFQHSLISSGILNEFQLILCRNTLIYFNNNLQEKVFKLFYNSIDISGFLVLGSSEGIISNNGDKYFKIYNSAHKIYKRFIVHD